MYQAIGKRDQQRAGRGEDRHHRGAHEGVPVQRLVEEGAVLREARFVDARRDARAQRQHRELDVRQHDQPDQPERAPARAAAEARAAGCAAARRSGVGGSPWRRRRAEADRALRIEAERDASRRRRRSAKRPVCGSAIRNSARRRRPRARSTAEFAPSNSRLSTRPRETLRCRRQLARRRAPARRPRAARTPRPRRRRRPGRSRRARTRRPSAGHELDHVAVDARVALPATRLLAPTKPATNGVAGW